VDDHDWAARAAEGSGKGKKVAARSDGDVKPSQKPDNFGVAAEMKKWADDERNRQHDANCPSIMSGSGTRALTPLHKMRRRWCILRGSNPAGNPTSTCAPSNAPSCNNVDQYICRNTGTERCVAVDRKIIADDNAADHFPEKQS